MITGIETSALVAHELGGDLQFLCGRLPPDLIWDSETFEEAWRLHPGERHEILIHGRFVKTPRFQQTFGADYVYTGTTNRALPTPSLLMPLLTWAQQAVFPCLNGLLLNWYEGPGHYIGPHHDSIRNMVRYAPIVTLSFGEARTFRLNHPKTKEVRDFSAPHGTIFVMPFETNLVWKHSVPKSARYLGRRISVTLRAFESGLIS